MRRFAETPTGPRGKGKATTSKTPKTEKFRVARACVKVVRGATLKVRNGIAKIKAKRRFVRRVDASKRTMFEFE